MSVNKVILIGHVGTEPEIRYMDGGVCVAKVRLATSERGYTLQNGTQVPERTDWHDVILWRGQAEYVEKYVHTGDKLYVEGKLQYRKYTDKQGLNRTTVEIMANNIEILSSAQQRKQNAEATNAQSQSTKAETPSGDGGKVAEDFDFPF